VTDGALLLAWAGFICWIADRKNSQVLALFAIGLAYYSSVITHAGSFTLYSNLVLAIASVFFLVRHRWAVLSAASLTATYASYTYWRFYTGNEWMVDARLGGLWNSAAFLISYWIVFTAAGFLAKDERFADQKRAAFLTINNGSCFTLFALTMLQMHHHGLWKLCLIYGGVLLGLTILARRLLPNEPHTRNACLSQGLIFVTVGIISHPDLAGLKLALILASESVILLMLGQLQNNRVLRAGAYVASALAIGWGMDGLKRFDLPGAWLAAALGGLMIVNAVMVHRRAPKRTDFPLRAGPGFFTVLALTIWMVATYDNSTPEHFPLVLAIEALLLTASIYALRVPEISLLGQGYVIAALVAWMADALSPDRLPQPWWSPAIMVASTLLLSHWWQKQKALVLVADGVLAIQTLYGIGMTATLYQWIEPHCTAAPWMLASSLLAVGMTAYGVVTRAWPLALCAQCFTAISAGQFAWQLASGKPEWTYALTPIAALALLSFGAVATCKSAKGMKNTTRGPLLTVAASYRWTALLMSLIWISKYIPARERIWLNSLLGLALFLIAGWRKNREALLAAAVFDATALGMFWLPLFEAPRVYAPNLVAIVTLLAQRQIARRLPDRYRLENGVHGTVIIAGGLSIWLFVSRWVRETLGSSYLTASWSVLALALFAVGIVLRERVYRWLGLAVLACTLMMVVFVDVWRLTTLYRVLSFTVLGIALLVLGFIYSKFEQTIRRWL
jgi:hypothetical protein